MGFIQSIFGQSEEAPRPRKVSLEGIAFISEEEATVCGVKQLGQVPKIAEQLRTRGAHESTPVPLQFSFYTNTTTKAEALVERLKKEGMEAQFQVAGQDETLFLVTGETSPMALDQESLRRWTERMCDFGYLYDAEMQLWQARWSML